MEVTTRFELVDEGFADPCLTTWPRHHIRSDCYHSIGAADEARTRYLHRGKVALYQMSYGRMLERFLLSRSLRATGVIIDYMSRKVKRFLQVFSNFFGILVFNDVRPVFQ